MKDIQDRILTIMSIKNLTNAEFAEAIGVQPSNISHILSGRNKPSLDLVMKIVKRYPEVRLEWLLQGDGSMNKEFGMDLFSTEKSESSIGENEISSAESKITAPDLETGRISQPIELKKENSEIKPSLNQEDRNKLENDANIDRKEEIHADSGKSENGIEKIVIFYRDKTFKVYHPN